MTPAPDFDFYARSKQLAAQRGHMARMERLGWRFLGCTDRGAHYERVGRYSFAYAYVPYAGTPPVIHRFIKEKITQ